MNDVEILLKASNLEVALLDYFTQPTVEEANWLRGINARLQNDQESARDRIERAMNYKESLWTSN